jgi:hypothetical protein
MFDEVLFHIEAYITTIDRPTMHGLRFWLIKYCDADPKDHELLYKLRVYLQILEERERYEDCKQIHEIIKEYESTGL